MSTATGLPEWFLDQANVPRNTEHNGKTRMLTLSERVSWLIRDRDEARKLAADAAHQLANERQVVADLREQVARYTALEAAARENMECTRYLSVIAKHGGHGLDLLVKVERSRNEMWAALDALDAEDGQ